MNYTLLIICVIVLSVINSVNAAVDRQPKTVRGKVLLPNGEVAQNAQVTVTCKSNVLTDTTSKFGNYEVTYNDFECEQFDTVYVLVMLNNLTASTTKEVQYFNGVNVSDIVLTAAETTSVPEFALGSAIMAGSVSLLAYTKLKKR